MRRANLGATALRRRRRADPMAAFDRLPPDLRAWIAAAALPWSPASVRRSFAKAVRRHACRSAALAELDRLEARLIARDAASVWAGAHPATGGGVAPAEDGDRKACRAAANP